MNIHELPLPNGTVSSDDVASVESYATNTNNYLESQEGVDIRIAVVKVERAITFPLSVEDFDAFQLMTDVQKRNRYKTYTDSIS